MAETLDTIFYLTTLTNHPYIEKENDARLILIIPVGSLFGRLISHDSFDTAVLDVPGLGEVNLDVGITDFFDRGSYLADEAIQSGAEVRFETDANDGYETISLLTLTGSRRVTRTISPDLIEQIKHGADKKGIRPYQSMFKRLGSLKHLPL